MPKTASTTTSVEDMARLFLSQGWPALYSSDNVDQPKIMDKQVIYLRGLAKKKSREGITDEQVRVIQRLVTGEGTKAEASDMISLLSKHPDGDNTVAAAPPVEDSRRDVEDVKADVRALLDALEAARETYKALSVIAEPADPSACVYCDKGEDDHVKSMHEFESPEPEGVLTYLAQAKVVEIETQMTEFFAQFAVV